MGKFEQKPIKLYLFLMGESWHRKFVIFTIYISRGEVGEKEKLLISLEMKKQTARENAKKKGGSYRDFLDFQLKKPTSN